MKTINTQQEEYKAFLKNIRKEREETSNFAKIIFTIITAVICAVIFLVIVIENSMILEKFTNSQSEDFHGVFKSSRKQKNSFEVPFTPRRKNILILGVDSNGQGTSMWEGTRSDTILVVNIDPKTQSI